MPFNDLSNAVNMLEMAAKREADWSSEALKSLARATNSGGATLWFASGFDLKVFKLFNLDKPFAKEYRSEWARHDPNFQYVLNYPDNPLVHDDLVMTDAQKKGHPYFKWQATHFAMPYRLMCKHVVGRFYQIGTALLRDEKYEESEISTFRNFAPAINRALVNAVQRDVFDLRQSPMDRRRDDELVEARKSVRAFKRQEISVKQFANSLSLSLELVAELVPLSFAFELDLLKAFVKHFQGHSGNALQEIEKLDRKKRRGSRELDGCEDAVSLRRQCTAEAARARVAYDCGDFAAYLVQARLSWDFAQRSGIPTIKIRARDLFFDALRLHGWSEAGASLSRIVPDSKPAPTESQIEKLLWDCLEPF